MKVDIDKEQEEDKKRRVSMEISKEDTKEKKKSGRPIL